MPDAWKDHEFLKKILREVNESQRETVRAYHEIDHAHCWHQGKSPACGLPLKTHKICCLCELPVRKNKL